MPTELLRNAILVDLHPPRVERGDLRVSEGVILERGRDLAAREDETVHDLAGKYVMPGLVCGHTHLFYGLTRGMPGPRRPARGFLPMHEQLWWRLDRALDPEISYLSALVGAMDAVRAGTTCLVDHHSSPGMILGSLDTVRRALATVGVRGVLSYQVTDRSGAAEREQALEETRMFLSEDHGPLLRGMVGGQASFALSDDALAAMGSLAADFGTGVHIHVAEDLADLEEAEQRHGRTLIERLSAAGCLGPRSVLAHGTHLPEGAITVIRDHQAWLVHNPRSNMLHHVGYALVENFGARAALGTDGLGVDMFEEARMAYFKAQDAGATVTPDQILRLLGGGARMVSELFGRPVGSLAEGGAADLLVLDYPAPTQVHGENLAHHVMYGLGGVHVESVMVGGRWVMWHRTFPGLDLEDLHARAREAAARLWTRFQGLPELPLSTARRG